jgi:hypothetical protein
MYLYISHDEPHLQENIFVDAYRAVVQFIKKVIDYIAMLFNKNRRNVYILKKGAELYKKHLVDNAVPMNVLITVPVQIDGLFADDSVLSNIVRRVDDVINEVLPSIDRNAENFDNIKTDVLFDKFTDTSDLSLIGMVYSAAAKAKELHGKSVQIHAHVVGKAFDLAMPLIEHMYVKQMTQLVKYSKSLSRIVKNPKLTDENLRQLQAIYGFLNDVVSLYDTIFNLTTLTVKQALKEIKGHRK